MDNSFLIGKKAWFILFTRFEKGQNQKVEKIECVIIDAFYQNKTRHRVEGWRVLIFYIDVYGNRQYKERYLDILNF